MSHPVGLAAPLANLLSACGIAVPLHHPTCVGTTKKGNPCRNRVAQKSRQHAWRQLEVLASDRSHANVETRLNDIAGLLLCKARHQTQAPLISQGWYDKLGQSNTGHGEESVLAAQSPRQRDGYARSPRQSPTPREVTPAQVRANQIPFHVSSTRLASVVLSRAENGRACTLALRTFRPGRQISEVYCGICQVDGSDDTVYLSCTECTGEYHWGCLEGWIRYGRGRSRTVCPSCRHEGPFDGFYCTPPSSSTLSAVAVSTPSEPGYPDLPIPPTQNTTLRQGSSIPLPIGSSDESITATRREARPVRRSGRTTRPPDFFRPTY